MQLACPHRPDRGKVAPPGAPALRFGVLSGLPDRVGADCRSGPRVPAKYRVPPRSNLGETGPVRLAAFMRYHARCRPKAQCRTPDSHPATSELADSREGSLHTRHWGSLHTTLLAALCAIHHYAIPTITPTHGQATPLLHTCRQTKTHHGQAPIHCCCGWLLLHGREVVVVGILRPLGKKSFSLR